MGVKRKMKRRGSDSLQWRWIHFFHVTLEKQSGGVRVCLVTIPGQRHQIILMCTHKMKRWCTLKKVTNTTSADHQNICTLYIYCMLINMLLKLKE